MTLLSYYIKYLVFLVCTKGSRSLIAKPSWFSFTMKLLKGRELVWGIFFYKYLSLGMVLGYFSALLCLFVETLVARGASGNNTETGERTNHNRNLLTNEWIIFSSKAIIEKKNFFCAWWVCEFLTVYVWTWQLLSRRKMFENVFAHVPDTLVYIQCTMVWNSSIGAKREYLSLNVLLLK